MEEPLNTYGAQNGASVHEGDIGDIKGAEMRPDDVRLDDVGERNGGVSGIASGQASPLVRRVDEFGATAGVSEVGYTGNDVLMVSEGLGVSDNVGSVQGVEGTMPEAESSMPGAGIDEMHVGDMTGAVDMGNGDGALNMDLGADEGDVGLFIMDEGDETIGRDRGQGAHDAQLGHGIMLGDAAVELDDADDMLLLQQSVSDEEREESSRAAAERLAALRSIWEARRDTVATRRSERQQALAPLRQRIQEVASMRSVQARKVGRLLRVLQVLQVVLEDGAAGVQRIARRRSLQRERLGELIECILMDEGDVSAGEQGRAEAGDIRGDEEGLVPSEILYVLAIVFKVFICYFIFPRSMVWDSCMSVFFIFLYCFVAYPLSLP